ncbi:MAG TPA: GTP-binding protein [Acidimicrobiales bacterium]|nr:GTP-binding protein [Acidimicrobiales bacterium]
MSAPLLRVATAGSVDDGKSTLIGRLLWDSKSILEDQAAAVAHASAQRGQDGHNLAMFTDGLRAERDRGITIDVAYRYFATPRRRFVLADTPGHFEFTRNMVTGASNADLAIVLIDARHGVVDQTRRHAVIAGLLAVPHVVVAVNKMDLVGWDEEVFTTIVKEFCSFTTPLELPGLTFLPISALAGDNVVEPSEHMAWYDGPPLLTYLEDVPPHDDPADDPVGARMAVQWVLAPALATTPADLEYIAGGNHGVCTPERGGSPGYAGQVSAGVVRRGAEVLVLPGGMATRIESIDTFAGSVDAAPAGTAVTVRLADDVEVTRGDLLCQPGVAPEVADELDAVVCWFAEAPLAPGTTYALKHTTRWAEATVETLRHRLDIETLEPDTNAAGLGPNDIGTVHLRLAAPLAFDSYKRNRTTGSFILVDQKTNATVAAGMILGASPLSHQGLPLRIDKSLSAPLQW